jgi:hypothetical protein
MDFFSPIPLPIVIVLFLVSVVLVVVMCMPTAWVNPFLRLLGFRVDDRRDASGPRDPRAK